MSKMKFITIELEDIRAVTEKAALCIIDERGIWVPFSVMRTDDAKAVEEAAETGEVIDEIDIHDWFVDKYDITRKS